MEIEEYIDALRNEEGTSSYIELSKDKEIAYMESHKYRYKHIAKSIPRTSNPIKILDIGTTPFTIFLRKNYPHYEISTLDRTDLMQSRCKAEGIGFAACDLDNAAIPLEDDYYDVVIFTEVLEHIFAPATDVLNEIGRIMHRGGKLILSVPNIAAINKRIKLLLGITPLKHPDVQMKKDWVHGHGHIHEYTMKEIISILKSCNFTISNKTFIQPGISDALGRANKRIILTLREATRCAAGFLIPSFKLIIFIECNKR